MKQRKQTKQEDNMKKKKVIITAVVIVAAAAIILPRFLKPKEEVAAASVPVVSIQKPEIGNIELYTGLTGTVEPSDIVYIIPKAAGEYDVYVRREIMWRKAGAAPY